MWRGPRQDGTSRETGLPVEWSATENIVWRLPLPGVAPSTPIVWDGKDQAGQAVASGTYFSQLKWGGRAITRPLSLVK